MNPRRTGASVSADESQCTLQRRAALRKTAAFLGGLASATLLPATAAEKTPHRTGAAGDMRRGSVIAADGAPIVDTGGGKVVGYLRNGIQTFKGIPYAESTEGANRFMPPVKVKAWSGVRSSRQYGNVAPQAPRQGWANDEEAFMFSWDDGVQGEDCLRINVWTPSANGNKRPVMVWLHGGGFSAGSGQELKSYDGENLARRGNVVVVSLNHRLNVLGHLNLVQYGDRYASSANLGMLDIVAALEWVRDYIEGFGGDPSAVTVFGQSGGGGKVGALMGMPAASGLFHRAIVESGSVLRLGSEDKSRQLAELIVAELGLNRTTIDEIQTLPYEKLIQASTKILSEHPSTPKGALPDFRRIANSLGFAPIVDGSILPAHPFDPQASALSADVPMIIGSTLNEFITAINHPEAEKMTEAELEQRVRGVYGDRTPKVIEAFKQRSPHASAFDLWSHIGAAGIRRSAIAQATAKAALGRAPAYLYWFAWQTPVLGGRPRAFHCAEIPFVFDNTDRCENMTGGGPDARALAAIMSDAWIQFARTGNPNHPRMPRWDAFSPDRKQTMIFDDISAQVNGPDAAEQDSIAEA
jgi:para-nitrobenzyl esterase